MLVTPDLLRFFPTLKPLPQEVLESLASQSSVHKYPRRSVVLNAGKRETNLCFLFEGHLQGVDFTIDGREVGLYFIEPGDFCGELGMFDGGPQPEYVIARTAAIAVFVPMEALRAATAQHAGVTNALAARLAARVRQMTLQRSLLGLPNVGQRVCCQLWMLVPAADKNSDTQNSEILNPPTHMEIAIMLSLSREAVSRVFQNLQASHIVSRDGPGKLLINDLQRVKAYAEGKEKL